ncbi:MAG: BlaI/MecI/CopY family transcriptional regulator [Lachnospiraceae bacterium]|nr:BlaI/MecI/CopY family transcriptional regulator [Lachnospiraceae bacterium]
MRKAEISDCELVAMKCVWDADEPVTCSYVIEQLKTVYDRDYAETTVYTFLKNLKTKGFIDSYRKGITYFVPKRDRNKFRDEQLIKTEKFWFDGSTAELITALLNAKELSDKEKADIKKAVKNALK